MMPIRPFLYVLLILSLLACAKTDVPSFTDSTLYIFGDSLSDVGNANAASAGLVPDINYYEGRFSNGPIFPDLLAQSLATPMKSSRSYGSNYAFAGMRSIAVNAQVFNYQENVNGVADAAAIYIIWSGANDLLELLRNPDSTNTVSTAIAHIANAIENLSSMGAQKIIVLNQVNMAKLPRTIAAENETPGTLAAASVLTDEFNVALTNKLNEIETIPEKNISTIRFDVHALFEDMTANPTNYGLENVSEPCYIKNEFAVELSGNETICDSPDEYLFWDSIHPTTAGHKILSEQLEITINAN